MFGAVHVVVPPLEDVDPPELLVEPPLEEVEPLLELVDPPLLLDVVSSPVVPPDELVPFVELPLGGLVVVESTEQAKSEDTTAAAANAAKG
jgi:hypothetical protein